MDNQIENKENQKNLGGDELNIAINDYIDTNTEDMNLILVDDPVQCKSVRLDKPSDSPNTSNN